MEFDVVLNNFSVIGWRRRLTESRYVALHLQSQTPSQEVTSPSFEVLSMTGPGIDPRSTTMGAWGSMCLTMFSYMTTKSWRLCIMGLLDARQISIALFSRAASMMWLSPPLPLLLIQVNQSVHIPSMLNFKQRTIQFISFYVWDVTTLDLLTHEEAPLPTVLLGMVNWFKAKFWTHTHNASVWGLGIRMMRRLSSGCDRNGAHTADNGCGSSCSSYQSWMYPWSVKRTVVLFSD